MCYIIRKVTFKDLSNRGLWNIWKECKQIFVVCNWFKSSNANLQLLVALHFCEQYC